MRYQYAKQGRLYQVWLCQHTGKPLKSVALFTTEDAAKSYVERQTAWLYA